MRVGQFTVLARRTGGVNDGGELRRGVTQPLERRDKMPDEYDKSQETVLKTIKVNDFDGKPEWGGTIVEIYRYQQQKPKVRFTRWYVPRGSRDPEISNFISISGSQGLKLLGQLLIKISEEFERRERETEPEPGCRT